MEVDLRHLRAFVVVAEEQNFGRAAKRLHVAQPALSRQIRKLEGEVGAELFDRTSRPIRLTAAGAAFLEEARLSLYHARRATARGREARGGRVGHLSVGSTFWAQNAIIPSIARDFRARSPGVSIDLALGAPIELTEDLRKERLDIAFAAFGPWSIGGRALEVEPLLEERMIAIVAEDHPFARRAGVSLEELAHEPFLSLSQAVVPGLVGQQVAIFNERGLNPVDVQEVHDPISLLTLIAGGVGVGLHMASFSNAGRRGVTFVPLEGDSPTATLFLLWRRGDDRELVRIFLETARGVAWSLDPPEVFSAPVEKGGQSP